MFFIQALAALFLGAAIVALTMAEFGWSSIIGNWNPTYETAIAYGIVSIACFECSKLLEHLD